MRARRLEQLLEAFAEKRMQDIDHACDGSPLNCLNGNELAVLGAVAADGPSTMGALAGTTGLPMSTLTGITDKLVAQGFLVRSRWESDRRVVRVDLTDTGREAFENRIERKQGVCRDILAKLSPAEQEQLLALLDKIVTD